MLRVLFIVIYVMYLIYYYIVKNVNVMYVQFVWVNICLIYLKIIKLFYIKSRDLFLNI